MLESSLVTICSEVVLRLPACCARLRICCTASSTASCPLTYASPSADAQERFLSRFARTDGNCVSALTLGSHDCWSTACARACPVRPEFCSIQRSASTISVGYVHAARICATSASGYSAMGATSWSICPPISSTTASPWGGGTVIADACEHANSHARLTEQVDHL